MLSKSVTRRQSPESKTSAAARAVVEKLEIRRMFYETGGQWENEDDLHFSFANILDGGITDAFRNSLPDSTIRAAVHEAMSVWAGVVPIKIQQQADEGPSPSDVAYFGSTRLLRFGHHFDDGEPATDDALAHAWGPNDLSSLAGDVHLDDLNDWGTFVSGSTNDILEVLVHEVGHALGMQHEDDVSCLMNSTQQDFYSGLGTAFLFQDDINGIQSLYGSGLGWVLTTSDQMFVSGTNSGDTITVDYDAAGDDLIVTSQGIGSFTIDEDSVLELVIDTRGGDDTVRIINLPADTDVVINAGLGNDVINVGGGDLNTNINSDVTVNGGSGTDELWIRDGDDDGGTYVVTPTSVSKIDGNLINFTPGDTEEVIVVGSAFDDTFNVSGNTGISGDITFELQGNDGEDTFNIDEVDDRSTMNLLGGSSHDTFNIGNGDFDTNIDGDIDVDGGDSGDIITVDDTADVGNDEYTLDNGFFARPGGTDGVLTYSNVSTFELDANGDANEINILGVDANTITRVDGRAGNDTFEVGDYDYDNNVNSTLTVIGGGGTGDIMRIRDDLDIGDDDYEFGVSQTFGAYFSKTNSSLTMFNDTLEQIVLYANYGNNDIYVGDTEVGTAMTLAGQTGNDDFYIGTLDQAVDGDLDLIDDVLVVEGGGGTDTVTFDDAGDAPVGVGGLPDSYSVTDSTLTKTYFAGFSQEIEYTGMETVFLEANADSSAINVHSTPAGTNVTLRGNDGNDTFRIGQDDNVQHIDGNVQALGGNGTDSLVYNDGASTADHDYTVEPNDLIRSNVANVQPLVESITVNAGSGSNVITVGSNNANTTINGGAGNDSFLVATGLWDTAVQGNVTVNGDAGTDDLFIDDSNDTGADAYSVTSTMTSKTAAFTGDISYNTIETYELAANSDANAITVLDTFDGDMHVRARGGADFIIIAETFPGRAVTVNDGPELDIVQVNANGVGTASAVFDTSQDLAALTIGNGGSVTLLAGGNLLINTQTLLMNATSQLDLADNAMVIDYAGASPINGVTAALTAGYAGGAWNGFGIRTSLGDAGNFALGYAEASALTTIPAAFGAFNGDAVLVRYTRYGDADLTGNVNSDDFNRHASNFGLTGKLWSDGNFNYDTAGAVNSDDFNLLAGNFGLSAAAGLSANRFGLPADHDSSDDRDLEELA